MLHRTGGDIEFPVIAKHRVAHINNVRVDLRERERERERESERESVCVCVCVCANLKLDMKSKRSLKPGMQNRQALQLR